MENHKQIFKYSIQKDIDRDFGIAIAKTYWKNNIFFITMNDAALYEFAESTIKIASGMYSEEHLDVKLPNVDPSFGRLEPGSKEIIIIRKGKPLDLNEFIYKPIKSKLINSLKWEKEYILKSEKLKIDGGICLICNSPALISLSKHLIDLAQPYILIDTEILYDGFSGLSKDSIPFIIKKT